jgi:hypothetical protein
MTDRAVSRKLWLASLAYVLLTVVMFWPLVRELRSGIPHDVGDPLLNTWILWWNAHAVPLTQAWWNGPAYWPLPDFLALSEHLLGLSVISTPLQWLGAGPQLAYNLLLVLSWPLSAVAAYALAWHLTGRHDAAFLGGLVFGFNPYRLGQTPHVQVVACWWMPIALLALHRALGSRNVRDASPWLALFGVTWLLQALSNGYFLFYFSVLVAAWIVWFTTRRRAWRIGLAIAATCCLAGLLTVPVLLKYKAVADRWHLTRGFDEIVAFSGDLSSFVTASELVRFWPYHPNPRPEQGLYPGAAAAALAVLSVAAALASAVGPTRARRRVTYALLGISTVFLCAAVATFAVGPWHWEVGPLDISGRQARKPLSLALVFLVLAVAFEPRFRGALRNRSLLAFYALGTILCFLMCLGPTGRMMGEPILEKPPYWWLLKLPGVENLRVPTRFAMVAMLPLAMTVALGFARLARRMPLRAQPAAAAACVMLIVADSWPRPVPMHAPREQYTLPAGARGAAVIELPLGDVVDNDIAAMIRGMSHGRPVANGYTGHFPGPYNLLRQALRERDPSALEGLATFSPLCIVIDRRLLLARNSRLMSEAAGARLIGTEREFAFYLLDRRPEPVAPARGTGTIVSAVASNWPTPAAAPIDGKVSTFWESLTRQRGGETMTLALREPTLVAGLALSLGLRIGGYPRRLVVETSMDAQSWTFAWEGPTAGLAFVGAVRDFDRTRFAVPFTPRQARFVRLRQTGVSKDEYWSIAEVELLR